MIRRIENFRTGTPTARKTGTVHPVLAGLRNRAQRTLSAVRDNITDAGPAPAIPEITPMSSTSTPTDHRATALRLHQLAAPGIDAARPLDIATTREAERAWVKFHAGHKSEVVALGLAKGEDFVAFMRGELSEIAR